MTWKIKTFFLIHSSFKNPQNLLTSNQTRNSISYKRLTCGCQLWSLKTRVRKIISLDLLKVLLEETWQISLEETVQLRYFFLVPFNVILDDCTEVNDPFTVQSKPAARPAQGTCTGLWLSQTCHKTWPGVLTPGPGSPKIRPAFHSGRLELHHQFWQR